MPVGHLYVFFGKKSVQVFCPFFVQVVCFFDIELYELFYILDSHVLSVISFANNFSHSVGCLFVLSVVSFNSVPIVYFFLLFPMPWETDPQKYCYDVCQRVFC